MTMLLEVENLCAGYGPVKVLRDVNFTVQQGDVAVVLGANGAGKTTTMRALSGMIPARGSVTFNGKSLLGRKAPEVARLGIAHVPQGRGTFADLTVEENLRLGAHSRRDHNVLPDMLRWFDVFPRLHERQHQIASSLSGGEQQMLAVARALMLRPKLLLLDEPSLGLAPIIVRELFDTLRRVNAEEGTTMLVVEQNANVALRIASLAYVLETGRVVISGTADEIRGNDQVRRAYLGY